MNSSIENKFVDNISNVNYLYKYINKLNLKPGTDLHDDLVAFVKSRATNSYNIMQKRHPAWKEINRTLTAYVPLDTYEKSVKEKDPRKPVSLVIPKTFATIETLLTYAMAAFGEAPYFRYEGSGPEDVVKAALLELVVDRQNRHRKAKALLKLHTMWRDSFAYGFGGVANHWMTTRTTNSYQKFSSIWSSIKNAFVNVEDGFEERDELSFEGNMLYSLDPFRMLPDPYVSIDEQQRGSFFGWVDRTNFYDLLYLEDDNKGFNVKYLKHLSSCLSNYIVDDGSTGRADKSLMTGSAQDYGRVVDVVYMYAKLIPKDWKLSSYDKPQKWLFAIAGDAVLIRAEPIADRHDMFPISICAPDYDGHSILPVGRVEVVYPAQAAIDWLISSRLTNIRKSVNNMFVVDPKMINMNDFLESKAGLLARIRREYWGTPGAVDKAIKQLHVTDVTASNFIDVGYLGEALREATGTTEPVSGVQRKHSGRVTAEEVASTRTSALGRLEHAMRIISEQAHGDIAHQQGHNTIQYMQDSTYVKILGNWNKDLEQLMSIGDRKKVDRKSIDCNFDILSSDGTIPGAIDTGALQQVLLAASGNPELYQEIDVGKVFRVIAKAAGVKNIEALMRKPGGVGAVAVEDETVLSEADKGNLIPANSI